MGAIDHVEQLLVLHSHCNGLVLCLLQRDASTVQTGVVQEDEVAIVAHCESLHTVFGSETLIDSLHSARCIPPVGRQFVLAHEVRIMCTAMVCREEKQVVATAKLTVEHRKEVG